MVALLHTYKDCFIWNHDEISSLDKSLVKYPLSIKPTFKPHK